MERNISELTKKEFDLVVIGGGIFGVCAAWEGVQRGLSVALVEKGDYSHATSAHHLKMVHGGIRYLQHVDVYRVRESCHERTGLLKIAPHLIQPLPVIMPTYGHGKRGKELLWGGVFLYNLITSDRNRIIDDQDRQIPSGRLITREEVLGIFPALEKKGLTGAAVFHDGQMYNPPRLAISFLRSAVDQCGAVAGNYLEATGFLRKGNRIVGVEVLDVLKKEKLEVRGKVVLNTPGPWAARLLESGLGLRLEQKPAFSRDACFVVTRKLSDKYALACQTRSRDADAILSRGGRHLFIAPWRGYTLVGVWHKVIDWDPDDFSVSEKELEAFIDESNAAYPGLSISREDVSLINAGLILSEESKNGSDAISFGKRSLLIDHEKQHNIEGLVTLIGVRATTARGKAEKAIDLILNKLGKRFMKSKTDTIPIYGGRIERFERYLKQVLDQAPNGLDEKVLRGLVHNYGNEYRGVLKYADESPVLAEKVGNSTVIKAEIIHAVREEMAQKLGDVVFRRTDLATGEDPGKDAIRICADLMATELGWTGNRIGEEIEDVKKAFVKQGVGKL